MTSRRCRRLITFVPFGSRFEHFDQCKTSVSSVFLSVAGPTLDPPLRTAEAVASRRRPLARVSFVNRCAIKVTGSRIYLMRNGSASTIFYYAFFITGAVERESCAKVAYAA